MEQVNIQGMSCQHCVAAVKSALEQAGLTNVSVSLEDGAATFTPTTAFSREQIAAVIDEAGYEAVSFQ